MDLKSSTCIPCSGEEPPLEREMVDTYLQMINLDWQFKGGPDRIVRSIQAKDFQSAIDLINNVAKIAEAEGHHPNIKLYDYKNLEFELFTHKIKGLHKNDFILAAKIDKMLNENDKK